MADNIKLRKVVRRSETISDQDETPSPASTPVGISDVDSEQSDMARRSETIRDGDETPSPASTPVDIPDVDSEKSDIFEALNRPNPSWIKKSRTYLEYVSVVVIMADGMTKIWQNPCEEPTLEMRVSERFLFVYFVCEMMLKILDQGFCRRGCFLRNPWNKLDALIIVAEILDYILKIYGIDWRISQPMKPLRVISRVTSLKNLVIGVMEILFQTMNIFLFFIIIICVFSIVGVQLWAGQLRNRCFLGENVSSIYNVSLNPYYVSESGEIDPFICSAYGFGTQHCSDVPRLREDGKVCLLDPPGLPQNLTSPTSARMNHGDCVNWNTFYNVCRPDGPNPYLGVINFDNLGSAWITIFQVISFEGWTDIMYLVMAPSSFWIFPFFIIVTSFGSLVFLNICTMVIATCYSESLAKNEEDSLVVALFRKFQHYINEWLDDLWSSDLAQTEGRQLERGAFFWFHHYDRLRNFVKGPLVWIMMVMVILNTIIMVMYHNNQSATWTQVLGVGDAIFTFVFVLEFILNVLVYQASYFMDLENLFDLSVMFISLYELGPSKGRKLSVLRSFRVLRFMKIFQSMPHLKRQMRVLKRSVTTAASLGGLAFLFIYIFSIIGTNLFGCKFKSAGGELINDRKNFDSPVWAMVTIFQLLTQDDWNFVLYNATATTSQFAAVYFVVLILFGKDILLNILVGIVVDSFQAEPQDEDEDEDEDEDDDDDDDPAPLDESPPVSSESTTVPIQQEEDEQSNPQEDSEVTATILYDIFIRRIYAMMQWFKDHKDWSLFLFSPTDKGRHFCHSIVAHEVFKYGILALIAISCITITFERPGLGPNSTERLVLDIFSHVITAGFMTEMFFKIIAKGLVLGKDAYCRSLLNLLDGGLVMISIFGIFLMSSRKKTALSFFKILRLLRILRILRMAQEAQRLNLVIDTLIASVKPMASTVLICSQFILVFAILGVQLFKGKFFYCVGEDLSNIKNKTDCLEAGYQWVLKDYNFDNLVQAIKTLLVMFTKDGWIRIMYDGLDGVEVDQQPVQNYDMWMLLYFISYMVLGYFLADMFIGVMVETYDDCRHHLGKEDVSSPPVQDNELEVTDFLGHSAFRRMLLSVCKSKCLEITTTTIVIINIALMGVEHYNQPKYIDQLIEYNFIISTIIIFIEAVMKVIAFGPKRYFKNCWNLLDIVLLLSSIIGIIFIELKMPRNVPFNPSIMRIFKVSRLTQVLKANGMKFFLKTIVKTIIEIVNVCILLSFFFFVYAALGVQLFGNLDCSVENPCSGLHHYSNFKNFPMALLTLYKIWTGDNWSGILKDCLRPCSPDDSTCSYNNAWVGPIYVFSFVILVQVFLMNMIVATITRAVEESQKAVQPLQILGVSCPEAVGPKEEGAVKREPGGTTLERTL